MKRAQREPAQDWGHAGGAAKAGEDEKAPEVKWETLLWWPALERLPG